jgi:phosphotransferase system enzyme I (PtsP)
MVADFQKIIRAVSMASSVDAALAILVRQVNDSLPIDAFAVYLTDTETSEFVLVASDKVPEPTGQILSSADAGLLGLVTERRELVVLTNAPAHARYAPAAEMGEQLYDTFLGVPLIHYHEVVGVLVGWKKLHGRFDKDEVSFFLTIAAQLAKVIYEASNVDAVVEYLRSGTEENEFIQGVQAASGVAIGTATLRDPLANLESVPDRQAVDINGEEATLRAAIAAVQAELGDSSQRMADVLPHDVREFFDAYTMMLGSDSLVEDTLVRIRAGNWAPGAWRETVIEHAQVFDRMDDPYIRARGEDIRELGTRVLVQMQPGLEDSRPFPERCILVGDAISIQDIASVPAGRLAGIVSRQGSAFSHTAVLANALGIPAVVSLSSLPFGLVEGSTMVVDGDEARIYVRPSRDVIEAIVVRIDEQNAISTRIRAGSEMSAQTLDGVRLPLHANIGLVSDIELAKHSHAEGVGLYRTEYLFLLRDAFPVEEEQYQRYRQLLEEFAGKPVTIRTLDVGGDKILSYFPVEEDNPFLGVRGIRFSLAHPEIFMIQLRALLRANEGLENLHVLFPMVAKISELDEALELLARAHRELLEEGQAVAKPKVGVMIEVPSAVFLTKAIATRVDFLSIGTNDLAQYVLAADRANARVTTPDDTLHPAVLNAINMVICDAQAQNTPVSVCGEMAGDPAGALVLLGMGVDELSMGPVKFAQVKLVVRSFTLERARELAAEALEQESENQVRGLLSNALEGAGFRKHRLGIGDQADSGTEPVLGESDPL